MKAFRGIRLCVLGMVVAGCSTTTPIDKTETLDQLGHVTAGHLIACDAAQWVSAEAAIEHTMDFARAREELQHPGECGPGCMKDLESWRQGAEQGALCQK